MGEEWGGGGSKLSLESQKFYVGFQQVLGLPLCDANEKIQYTSTILGWIAHPHMVFKAQT